MVTLSAFIVYFITPASLAILAILLFPLTPNFVLSKFSKYIWEMSLSVNGFNIKVVHLMLLISLVNFTARIYSLVNSLHPHDKERVEFTLEESIKFNRASRDFYISLSFFGIWIYIWRVIPLVKKLVS